MNRFFIRILSAIFLLWAPLYGEAATRYIGEDHTVVYTITDSSGDHVTGEAPTLMVRRDSDGYVYDWDDSTFKNTGWTTKSTALTEESTDGYYYLDWTPPGSETTSRSYAFIVDNADTSGYGDHQIETVSYVTKPLHPTTADRTLDVTATGAAGIDWANIENPTTTVDLSATTTASSGSSDWTAGEKADILEALSVDDGDVDTHESLEGIWRKLKTLRP